MCENAKRFLKNSRLSFFGFLLTDAVFLIAALLLPDGPHRILDCVLAVSVFLAALVSALLYGSRVFLPMQAKWQTVLSATLLPIAALILLTWCGIALQFEVLCVPIAMPGNILYMAISDLYTGSGTDMITCAVLAPLTPFLCMSIGAVLRERKENTE